MGRGIQGLLAGVMAGKPDSKGQADSGLLMEAFAIGGLDRVRSESSASAGAHFGRLRSIEFAILPLVSQTRDNDNLTGPGSNAQYPQP